MARTLVLATGLACIAGACAGGSPGPGSSRARVVVPRPPLQAAARRMRPRPGAIAPGTVVASAALFTNRVFANARDGFALANDGSAQYPVDTVDGGRVWRIDGPQVHIDAADGAEGVGYVGVAGPRMFLAFGSSVVDVTTDGGHTWWESFLGELVTAVVPVPVGSGLVAYVQQSVSNNRINPVVTWVYHSGPGGLHWEYTTNLGG